MHVKFVESENEHKTLEERSQQYGGNLNLESELEWDESIGREVW